MAATMDRKSCLLVLVPVVVLVFHTFITLLLITIHFRQVSCQLEDLSPNRIISEVENSCVLVFVTQNNDMNDDNVRTSAVVADELYQILTGKKEITFGTSGIILNDGFIWPNGQPLQWVGGSSRTIPALKTESYAYDGTFFIAFQKWEKDRTCLINGPKLNPKAEHFDGMFTVETVLRWVNAKCNTYISPTGELSYQGMHRESILHNLHRMSHVSNFTMWDFDRQSQWKRLPSGHKNLSESALKLNCKHRKVDSYVWDEDCDKTVEGMGYHGYCSARQSVIANENIQSKPVSSNVDSETSKPVEMVDFLQDFHTFNSDNVRPDRPSTRNIPQCERLSTLPTKGQFFYDYLKTSKPVIIEGAVAHWDAFHKWTMEFLRERYGDKEVHIKLAPDGLFEGVDDSSNWEEFGTFTIPTPVLNKLPFPDLVVVRPATINLKFSKFLDMISNVSKIANESSTKPRASAYLEYSSIPNYLPELEQDIEEFPFVQDLLKRLHLNIWLSDGNTLGKLHFDPFDNFLCQIRGTKQLILFEPHENTKMYEGHIPEAKLGYDPVSGRFRRRKLQDSTAMVMAPVDILKPDFQRFPAFAETRPLNCTINEGDVLFMPAFWWHEVQSYPNVIERRNMAVNFWYEPFLTKEFPCAHCKLDVNPVYRHLL